MLHTSYIELDPQALHDNLNFLHGLIPEDTCFSMVVKANAYGHGIEEIVVMAEEIGVHHFSVFSVAEAMRVQEVKSEKSELMIMGFIDDDYLGWAIEHEVSFYVFSLSRLQATIEEAGRLEKPARIHLELETGMYRTGFCEEDLPEMVRLVKAHSRLLTLEGLCTHFAGAEDLDSEDRIRAQIDNFRTLCTSLQNEGITPRYRHAACSGALFNYPETVLDMVRIGISCYGYWPNRETRQRYFHNQGIKEDPLSRILSWKSKIMSLDTVPEGAYVSYGKSYLTKRSSKIATIPVGYGYGFSRTLSNDGYVLVGGQRAPVVGFVNMNIVVIDVTDIPNVEVNDEVVLIGRQGEELITVSSFSDMNNSMNYELLTRLPGHIPKRALSVAQPDTV